MRAKFMNRQWVLLGDDEKEIARFKSRVQLLKYWEENPDAKAQESSEEKKSWLDKEEDSDEEEDEEGS